MEKLGYLWAFSGKLADSNHHEKFVPTVYDMLDLNGFYKIGEDELNQITSEIESLKKSEDYKKVIQNLENTKTEAFNDIQNQKNNIKVQKKLRDEIRKSDSYSEEELKEASKKEGILLKKMTQFWNYKIDDAQKELDLSIRKLNT